MSNPNSVKEDIIKRFDEKCIELKDALPPMRKNIGNGCGVTL